MVLVENLTIYDSWDIESTSYSCSELSIFSFSVEERDMVLEALRTNQFAKRYKRDSHSQYFPAIKFWFFTGCRTGELLGLRWQDINSEYIMFSNSRIRTNQGEILKESLKRQSSRRFPVNIQLQEILGTFEKSKKTDYVFLNKEGKPLVLKSLVCCWKRVLAGLELPYRRPYQCRHTFISICLNSGKLSPAEVAKLVGTSPAMIYKHYLGVSGNIEVPIL